ncbi:hypothetical protein Arnit_0182 [Arcobacter nitrofigilis DSM 7299]|uniref:Uncharacterized protein n=1 Tax=Arcobacter nitrofigilis (strain ATCC 33309 / DSM 7299 / CCUG 15893 / LMG 7604 / NCTC 12251 / CI) TaxID=572480 RepID=D5V4B6_ARCNC|nr:hypothetical protein [Arcobacter nitrofigilis]ADG91849.1 hypothetical protein Arnit_0182 [Arcobacter nitrofigilis DSM 7299]
MFSKVLNPNFEEDFKIQAKLLKKELFGLGFIMKHAQSLELLSKIGGFSNYKERCNYMKEHYPLSKSYKHKKIEYEKKKVLTIEEIYQEVKAEIIYILHNYEEDEFLDAVGCSLSELTADIAFSHVLKYIEKYKILILEKGVSAFDEGGVYFILKDNYSYHLQDRNIKLTPHGSIVFDDTIIANIRFNTLSDRKKKISMDILSDRLIEYGRLPTDYTWGYKDGSSTFNTAMVILDECLVDYNLNDEKCMNLTRKFAEEFLIHFNQDKEANISEYRVIKWVHANSSII